MLRSTFLLAFVASSPCSAFAPPPPTFFPPPTSLTTSSARRPRAASSRLFQYGGYDPNQGTGQGGGYDQQQQQGGSYDPNQQPQGGGGSASQSLPADLADIQSFLSQQFPTFYSLLLSTNDAAWKSLRSASSDAGGYTIFAPNEAAFASLGEKRCNQLSDPRNGETAEKIGLYHCVNEPVSAEELFNAGGIITLGGEAPVGRNVKGGFFGIGGTEDGGVKVGGANVVQSSQVGGCTVHEVDGLISPELLWRYIDQLRIPGSS